MIGRHAALVGVVALATLVNVATEVRLSNSDHSQWVAWPMPEGRTMNTWWRHDAGFANVAAQPDGGVLVDFSGQFSFPCYQNNYGINAGGATGGGFPSTYELGPDGVTWGWSYPLDACMSVATMKPGSQADGFVHNGNGQDGPSSEADWPNGNFNRPPHAAVWLR